MNDLLELKGRNVLLRKPQLNDIHARMAFGFPIEYIKMCGGNTKILNEFTADDGAEWYKKIFEHPCKWVIEYGKIMIGEVGLTPYTQDNKARFSIGIFDCTKFNLGIGNRSYKTGT